MYDSVKVPTVLASMHIIYKFPKKLSISSTGASTVQCTCNRQPFQLPRCTSSGPVCSGALCFTNYFIDADGIFNKQDDCLFLPEPIVQISFCRSGPQSTIQCCSNGNHCNSDFIPPIPSRFYEITGSFVMERKKLH